MSEKSLYINVLEPRVIRLGLGHLTRFLTGKSVDVFSDITALTYLAMKGDTHSTSPKAEAQKTLLLGRSTFCQILTQFVKEFSIVLADRLSRQNQIISTGSTLHHEDPSAIATDAFLYNWNHQDLYAFTPFALARKVLNKLRSAQDTSLILLVPFWLQKEWFPDLVQASVDTLRRLLFCKDPPCQPHVH